MTAVTRTWFGLVAVGDDPRGGTSWWSVDGRAWTAAQYPDPALRNATLSAVAASDSMIVATGSREAVDGQTHPAIWSSTDGVAWTPADGLAPGANGFVSAVTSTPTGFVAVGELDAGDGSTEATAWRSSDGMTWTNMSLGQGTAAQVANGPAGLLVLG